MKSTKVYSDSTLKDSRVTWHKHTHTHTFGVVTREGSRERNQGGRMEKKTNGCQRALESVRERKT